MENKAMKFNPNLPTEVELTFDEPKTGDGKYGTWYLYGTKENIKGESGFFATEILHEKLQAMGVKTGSNLIITKIVKDDKTAWDIKLIGGETKEVDVNNLVSDLANKMDVNKPNINDTNEVKELSLEEKVNILWAEHDKKQPNKNLADDLPF